MKALILIVFSFLIAILLTLLPLPEWAIWYRPEWVLLVLIYWVLALPHRVGVLVAWLLGLFMDLLQANLLGIHAFIYVLVAYMVAKLYPRIRMFPLFQQALVVLMLLLFYQFTLFWIQGLLGHSPNTWHYWLMSVTSAIIWPFVFLILRRYRRRLGID